jgi:hypothetical protein
MARARWFDPYVASYLDELQSFGLYLDRAHVADLLTDAVASTAGQMGISEVAARRYLRHEDIREMARQAAIGLAAEQPGADLLAAARPILAGAHDLGLALAAVAVAGRVLARNGDGPGADDCLGLVATAGLILVETPEVPVALPSGWIHRLSRLLERAADVLDAGGALPDAESGDGSTTPGHMADRLRDDAIRLRGLAQQAP